MYLVTKLCSTPYKQLVENWKKAPNVLFHVLAYNSLSSSSDALKNKDKSNRYVCADNCKELHL